MGRFDPGPPAWRGPGFYGGVEHVTSLIQCEFGGRFGAAHADEGFNCAYIDGHVKWLDVPASVRDILMNNFAIGTYGNTCDYAGKGFWPWATYMDG